MRNKWLLCCSVSVGAILLGASGVAFAQPSDPSLPGETVGTVATTEGGVAILAGVRTWASRWDVPIITRTLDPVSMTIHEHYQPALSDTKFVPMPVLGIRYGNWLASATYFPETSYDTNGALAKSVKRKEYDLNVGYYILPSLAISLGYKGANIDRASDIDGSAYKIKAILVGLSGSAPIADKLSVYGNIAYGLGQEKTEFPLANGKSKFDGNYIISEFGLSYQLVRASSSEFLKGVVLSAGYRAQTVTINSFPLGTFLPAAPTVPVSITTRDARSTTDGFVINVVGVF